MCLRIDYHCRAITFHKTFHGESVVVHTPRTSNKGLAPSYLNSPSTFWFYHYKLPENLSMYNHRGKKYVACMTENKTIQYFTLEKGDIVFLKKDGGTEFKPLEVYREFKMKLDKTKTKQVREKLKPFLDYAQSMIHLVESEKWISTNPLKQIPKSELFRQEPNEHWYYLSSITNAK